MLNRNCSSWLPPGPGYCVFWLTYISIFSSFLKSFPYWKFFYLTIILRGRLHSLNLTGSLLKLTEGSRYVFYSRPVRWVGLLEVGPAKRAVIFSDIDPCRSTDSVVSFVISIMLLVATFFSSATRVGISMRQRASAWSVSSPVFSSFRYCRRMSL